MLEATSQADALGHQAKWDEHTDHLLIISQAARSWGERVLKSINKLGLITQADCA